MRAVFVFSGQGAQKLGMGADLFESSAAARNIFNDADRTLGWSVSELCFTGPEEKLTESRYCQPAIYTVSCACLAAFREKYPQVKALGVAGLSLGEFAALQAAGVFDFADGLQLVARRGELMDRACRENPGTMASVLGGDAAIIMEICAACDIDAANFNCPGQIVISGTEDGISKAVAELKERGFRKVIPLKVAGAYHSRLMRSAGEQLATVLADIPMREPTIPVAQNVSGEFAADTAVIKANIVAQVAGTVRWEDCVKTLIGTGADTLIEFGPGNVLTGLVRRIDPTLATFNINSSDSLDRGIA